MERFTDHSLAEKTGDRSIPDAPYLAAGRVKFSLVTGVTVGVEWSLGKNSAGAERANTNPCP